MAAKSTFVSGAVISTSGVIFVTLFDDNTWRRQAGFDWLPVEVDDNAAMTTQRRAFAALKRFGGRRLATGVFAAPRRTLQALMENAMSPKAYIAFRKDREGEKQASYKKS